MSLSPVDSCKRCGVQMSYVDENGTIFSSNKTHESTECLMEMSAKLKLLQAENMRLKNEWHCEKLRCAKILARQNLLKAPQDQKEKLLDQVYRWKALYERERYRRWALKKAIMNVYGTLDFRVETGAIVDVNAKSVAEYVSVKLRELIRKSSR